MILSDALSRRADAEELKEKDRTITLFLEDLFVRRLDIELSQILIEDEHEYDQPVLKRLQFLLEAPDAEDSEWTTTTKNGQPIIFYQGRQYVPRNTKQC